MAQPLWKDGRSGLAGCYAGNLALVDIARKHNERLSARKGTTFNGRRALLVGRVCSTDAYLNKGTAHWANLGPEQHAEVATEAKALRKNLVYLFITATAKPPGVHYWALPGELVGRVLPSLPVKEVDKSCHIRIQEKDGRYFLQDLDISKYHSTVSLVDGKASKLTRAFEDQRRREQKRPQPGNASNGFQEFSIPLRAGQSAVLRLPKPTAEADLARIKAWIDLMADVLTES
jgi:hypothetical protein